MLAREFVGHEAVAEERPGVAARIAKRIGIGREPGGRQAGGLQSGCRGLAAVQRRGHAADIGLHATGP